MAQIIRLLSYNVRSLRDDKHAVAAVIRACKPDVVCIQEAPRFFRWRTKCSELARQSGLVVVTGGRTAGAMLLMTTLRIQVDESRDVLLSKKRGLHQRGIALARLRVADESIVVASVHLDLDANERLRHVGEIRLQVQGFGGPAVVAGDINEEPTQPAWQALAAHYSDAYATSPAGGEYTYSSHTPVKRIDGIFVDPLIDVIECGVPDVAGVERASDHLPVLVVLRLSSNSGTAA